MCNKCRPKQHKIYWLHIADAWNEKEQMKMLAYLTEIARANSERKLRDTEEKKQV